MRQTLTNRDELGKYQTQYYIHAHTDPQNSQRPSPTSKILQRSTTSVSFLLHCNPLTTDEAAGIDEEYDEEYAAEAPGDYTEEYAE